MDDEPYDQPIWVEVPIELKKRITRAAIKWGVSEEEIARECIRQALEDPSIVGPKTLRPANPDRPPSFPRRELS